MTWLKIVCQMNTNIKMYSFYLENSEKRFTRKWRECDKIKSNQHATIKTIMYVPAD